MKKVCLTLCISLLIVGACSKEMNNIETKEEETTEIVMLHELKSHGNQWAKKEKEVQEKDNQFEFKIKEDILQLHQLISNAKKEPGIVNMTDPNYQIVTKEGLIYLWLEIAGERATIMKEEDTHTIYTLNENQSNELKQIIKRAKEK